MSGGGTQAGAITSVAKWVAPTWGQLLRHFTGEVAQVPHGKLLYSVWGSYLVWLVFQRKRRRKPAPPADKQNCLTKPKRATGSTSSIKTLAKVLMQHMGTKHGGYLLAYIASLISRVFVTVKIADAGGLGAGYFGARQWSNMFRSQALFGTWCFVGALCSGAMKYLEKRVALSFREILYTEIALKYLDPEQIPFYRVQVDDPQSRLTSDLDAFARDGTHLLGYFLKPTIDICHLSYVLGQRIGPQSLGIFAGFFFFASFGLTRVKNSLPKGLKQCSLETQQYEGDLRDKHQKIHDAREQIALQRGTLTERDSAAALFNVLSTHMEGTNRQYILMDVLNTYVLKYGGQMAGFSVLIPREYMKDPAQSSLGSATAGFISDSSLLGSLANAVKDLADSFVAIPKVAGLAARVEVLLTAVTRLPPRQTTALYQGKQGSSIVLEGVRVRTPTPAGAPSGELPEPLVDNVNLTIHPGHHTLVRGPNGAGKTSLFRVVGGLWQVEHQTMSSPASTFIVPQDTYFTTGTLADQITYPKLAAAADDEHVQGLLGVVGLEGVSRTYGLGGQCEWGQVLSGGQKQRLAWARLYYHRPSFGFVDEGTSAVSKEVIAALYSTAKAKGITLVSIAHDNSLAVHHDFALDLQGQGAWSHAALRE